MSAADQPEILDADSWPAVAIERQPNGMLGVKLTFPSPPMHLLMLAEADELSFNIEPKRARRLRDQLDALIKDMGL